jgi:hypothetical protein
MISKYVVICVIWTSPLQAWWSMGHRLVGYIGEKKLNSQTRSILEPLLKQHIEPYDSKLIESLSSFPDASIWFDFVKNNQIPDLHATHYINIPLAFHEVNHTFTRAELMERLTRARMENPYNVIECLNWSLYQLAGYFTDQQVTTQRAAALRYLLHLMGDLHQPLHVISLILPNGQGDEGGNKLRLRHPIGVKNLDREVQQIDKLHMVWDSALGSLLQDSVQSAAQPREDRQAILDQAYQELERKFGGQPDSDANYHLISEWAISTFLVAQTQIYQKIRLPQENALDAKARILVDLIPSSEQYQKDVAPLAQQAIWKGGVHLAKTLNLLQEKKFQYMDWQKNWEPML